MAESTSEKPIPKLLFILNADAEKSPQIQKIIQAKYLFYWAGNSLEKNLAGIHKELKENDFDGVVIIGSYCSVPSQPLRVLSDDLFLKFEASFQQNTSVESSNSGRDKDNFIIWSDDFYVDYNGDSFPELPISRIPFDDIESIGKIFKQKSQVNIHSAGIYNVRRSYSKLIFQKILKTDLNYFPSSLKFEKSNFNNLVYQASFFQHSYLYFVLHGKINNPEFYGGDLSSPKNTKLAIDLDCIPKSLPSTIIFNTACWGALIVDSLARNISPNATIECRTHENSAALKFLYNGASAYIGSTGSHYSPGGKIAECFCIGVPMDWYFWENIQKGQPPALALFNAKVKFALGIPHNPLLGVVGKVYELKILFEFTCLGLGW